MSANLILKKQENAMMEKPISSSEAMQIIKRIEEQINFEILPLIEKVVSKEADSFSIRKDEPDRYLFISNSSEKISLIFRSMGKETEVSIPKTAFKD